MIFRFFFVYYTSSTKLTNYFMMGRRGSTTNRTIRYGNRTSYTRLIGVRRAYEQCISRSNSAIQDEDRVVQARGRLILLSLSTQ